jgi:hypothetical protein
MHRALELCCHGAAERAATVLQANLAALRSESEAVAHAHAQVLVRLLTKVDDELIATRCAMALRIPHGLLALIKELVQSNPPAEAASRAEVEAEAEAANGGSPPRMRLPKRSTRRCGRSRARSACACGRARARLSSGRAGWPSELARSKT